MKVRIGEIYNRKQVVESLMQKDFSGKLSLKLSLLNKAISPIVESVEKVRVDLIKKYGEADGDKFEVKPNTEGFFKFIDEFNEALTQEVEFTSPDFTLEELVQDETIKISGQTLNLFEFFTKKE